MAARAIWKGEIKFAAVRVPVKVYSAVEDRDIHFHLLHDQDMVRLQQRMMHPKTNETVAISDAKKGYEVKQGVFVRVDEELDKLEPPASRDIVVERFVPRGAIHHQWYLRPYYLGPDGSTEDYFALAKALADEEAAGVAQWVMRKKGYLGALGTERGYLMLFTLRSADQVISAGQLEPPEGRALDAKERQLAEQLIATLEDEFSHDEYRDEYRDRMRGLIDAKREGKTVEVREYEHRPEAGSLANLLRESVKLSRSKPR